MTGPFSLASLPFGARALRRAAGALAVVAFAVTAFAPAAFAAHPSGVDVRVVNDASGSRVEVDGRPTMIFGMNWGYMPIGQNYLYDFWSQPDDFIRSVLDREMPMLRDMGVNAIRQYVGIPPKWVRYIYENYGIFTVINHPMARYGYTLDGVWIPHVDYSDPKLRRALVDEMSKLVREYRDTPGVLMWLLGNENNYGLEWTTFEAEALPEGEREAARARPLYSLFDEVARAIHRNDPGRPVAIANGDVQYIDVIAQECRNIDVFGTNVYRGISARDLFDVVRERLGIPVMFTEFGCDAWDAKNMREDQLTQARYLLGQWEEIYEQSYGKGRAGNAVGGFIFQWSDGWWKYKQEERLDVHDTHASWPNGGYPDYVPGQNNMNEEWWGITAKGKPDANGYYEVYPRAAYYALRQAFTLSPYSPDTDIDRIRRHFAAINPMAAVLSARGDAAALATHEASRARLAGVRLEFETYNTGGRHLTTPENPTGTPTSFPAYRGFDRLESFYADFEAEPAGGAHAKLSVNILGNVPLNPIDEIFYENRGRPRDVQTGSGVETINDFERVKVYQASIDWDARWFTLTGFYRTGHLHWQFEGDYFGIYRNAYYGENIDIYNGEAPVGFEIEGKRALTGLKVAYGPQLWWGANPAVLAKYRRNLGRITATLLYREDIAPQTSINSSIAIPLPQDRTAALTLEGGYRDFGFKLGGIWGGDPDVGRPFQVLVGEGSSARVMQDRVRTSDTFGARGKITWEHGRYHAYAEAAYMGIVAEGGPDETVTFTGWRLKNPGTGNQRSILAGIAINMGKFQVAPNFAYQKPLVGPVPADAPQPSRPHNVLDDPFAVGPNREMWGAELVISYDPTPATWMWAWDNDVREDARLAASLGIKVGNYLTTRDASIGVLANGATFAFPAAPPAHDFWEVRARVVSKLRTRTRLVAHAWGALDEPNGWDPNQPTYRLIHRYGADARLTWGPTALAAAVKVNDFGPYDYHRDFDLTFPLQIMADASYTLGSPRWFEFAQTRVGLRLTWRSLDRYSPRYCPAMVPDINGNLVCDPTAPASNGTEWEIRSYMHFSM